MLIKHGHNYFFLYLLFYWSKLYLPEKVIIITCYDLLLHRYCRNYKFYHSKGHIFLSLVFWRTLQKNTFLL